MRRKRVSRETSRVVRPVAVRLAELQVALARLTKREEIKKLRSDLRRMTARHSNS
jgi:hypothetical protein